MFSVTVRDHMMVAHSLRGRGLRAGPAAARRDVRGGRDVPRRRAGRRRHPRRHRPGRRRRCTRWSPALTYRNLDDDPAFAGTQHDHRGARPARRRPAGRAGARGRPRGRPARSPGSRSSCTSPTSPGRATSGTCDRAAPSTWWSRPASTTRRGPAAATPTTGGCATGWPRSAGRCASSRSRALAVARPCGAPGWPAAWRASPTARWSWSTGWSRGVARACWCPASRGCGSSCSSTCRSARSAADDDVRGARGGGAAGRGRGGHHERLDPALAGRGATAWTRPGVHVAAPGRGPRAPRAGEPRPAAAALRGAVTPAKGHDLLVAALARVADLAWRCVCVGALDLAPGFVAGVRRDVRAAGLDDRVAAHRPAAPARRWTRRTRPPTCWCSPSRAETYGMVVTEALARGLPVLATRRRRRAGGAGLGAGRAAPRTAGAGR